MKTIMLTAAIALLTACNIYAQHCPDGYTDQDYLEVLAFLDKHRPTLKNVRKWAIDNKRMDIETACRRLDYWSRKTAQWIRDNRKKNPEEVCNRIFGEEKEYMKDYMLLAFLYAKNPTKSGIDFSKYK